MPPPMLPPAAIGRFALTMMVVATAVLLTSHTQAIAGVGDTAPMPIRPSVVWQDLMDPNQEHAPALLKGIQLEDGRHVELSLEPFNIMAEDGLAVIAGKHGEQFLAEEDLVHLYRGTLQSDADTQVFLAATDKRMNGFIRIGDETHIISSGPITPWKSETLYVTALSGTIDDWIAEGPFCRVDEIEQPFALAIPIGEDPAPLPAGECTVIEIAVDSDWEFTDTLFGGDADASEAYAITLTAAVSEIYVEDMQVRLQLNYVRTWTSNTDPYTVPNNRLDEFKAHWNANMTSVDRDIAHLLSAPFSGGLAWLSVLCNPTQGYAVSGSLDGIFPYPLQDNHWQNWDLVVMAHELGHNFGCEHTHDLGIDGCGFDDCTDAHLGTIMSYCHLCPGGMTNISLSFHPQNRTQMNNLFNSTSCDVLGDCTEVPVGACCIQTVCVVVAEDTCDNGGGTWLGDGTNCADDPCEPIEPVGGCCDDINCSVITENDCRDADGTYLGDGTDCEGDPCGEPEPAQRLVICEEFTATWCTYCPLVAEALYNLQLDRPDDLIALMVHGGDAYTTAWGDSRLSFYGVGGYPTVWSDGWNEMAGSYGSVEVNYEQLDSRVDECLARPTDVSLNMQGEALTESQYQISGEVAVDADGEGKTIRIQLIQCYDQTGWPEPSEAQFNTVRQAANSFDVTLAAGESHAWTHTFTLSGESLANLDEVTYICIAQTPNSSGPAQVHNSALHEHEIVPTGGCCVVADCSVTSEANCDQAGGTWLGGGTDCEGEPCGTGEPLGACCIDYTCSITIELQCSGTWLGEDTTCDDDPCAPVGACCVGDVCSITKLDDCGGTWQGAETNCDQNPCIDPDPSGACCHGSDCSLTTEAGCSGDWQGEGTDCTVNPCEAYLLVPDEFPTIQDAIASASDGDVILVSPGTYTATDLDFDLEVINTSGLSIELRSSEGPESTIIDGQKLRPVIVCTQNETAETIINGFTITGGASPGWGGGIFCRSSSPTFTNCIITDNTSAERGGGVYLHRADPTFNECTWTENESDTGGGLYSSISSPVLTDCFFGDNFAFITGGAIHAAGNAEPVISDSVFCHNLPDHISGEWTDEGGNSMLDECEGCSGDIGILDDVVDLYDLQALLGLWGTDDTAGDIDGDGTVGISDLLAMLVNWGPC
ncbi:MAG: hypothetical protein CMJ63_02860 [Planctomycetaceae bacterium]|nr:hypothetical protein [Planctomycetaceae bacterium]